MKENKIPTAEEFVKEMYKISFIPNQLYSVDYLPLMRDFAKMHIKKQQEEIMSKVTANGNIRTDLIDFIPKCYPLENIK